MSEDLPETPGPNASMQFGEATQAARAVKEMESAGGGTPRPPGAPGPTGPPGGPGGPGGVPGGVTPPGVVQPGPAEVGPPVGPSPRGRVDPRAVFSPNLFMASRPEPWRDRLRRWARHPDAGVGLKVLADAVAHQRGPLEEHLAGSHESLPRRWGGLE